MTLLLALACFGSSTADSGTTTSPTTSTSTTGTTSTTRTVVDFSERGVACLFSAAPPTDGQWLEDQLLTDDAFAADAPIDVVVRFSDCVSSSAQDIVTSCTATLAGGTLTVSGTATWTEGGTSVSDCNEVRATCPGPVLPAGTFDVTYAGQSTSLTVPYGGPTPCTLAP